MKFNLLKALLIVVFFGTNCNSKEALQVNCDNECEEGTFLCSADKTRRLSCADFDDDGCLEWAPQGDLCENNTECRLGECRTPCAVDCIYGDKRCDDNALETCLEGSDGCYVWESQNCPANTICSQKQCVSTCSDECPEAGFNECVPGQNASRECGRFDDDPCLRWSEPVQCTNGEACSGGVCNSDCQHDCVPGEAQCTDNNSAYMECQERESDHCLIYSDPIDCGHDYTCESGSCVLKAECTDECEPGNKICASDGNSDGYRICGNFDDDDCLDYGNINNCPSGKVCYRGECHDYCANDCSEDGATECYSGGYRLCGNYDSDYCLEWSNTLDCPEAKTCENDYCVFAPCTDQCNYVGQTRCNDDSSGVLRCADYNGNGCLEWGQLQNCSSGLNCRNGQCVCLCDDDSSICNVETYGSTADCSCDPQCTDTEHACSLDQVCDTACGNQSDPDCDYNCLCNTTNFCDTNCDARNYPSLCGPTYGSSPTEITCSCDYDCRGNRYACTDDGYDDDACPLSGETADPDYYLSACRSRYIYMHQWFYGNDENFTFEGYHSVDDEEQSVKIGAFMLTGAAQVDFSLADELADCYKKLSFWIWAEGDGSIQMWDFTTGSWNQLEPLSGSLSIIPIERGTESWQRYVLCYDYDHCYSSVRLSATFWGSIDLSKIEMDVQIEEQ